MKVFMVLILTLRSRPETVTMKATKANFTKAFNATATIYDLKAKFKEFCFQFHPDVGGDTESMKLLNQVYQDRLKSFDGHTWRDAKTNKDYTYKYNPAVESDLADLIAKLVKLEGVTIEIIGVWVWLSGDATYDYKEFLKGLGMRFSKTKRSWYWASNLGQRKQKGYYSLNALRGIYGSEEVEKEDNTQTKKIGA
jgi:hypothetical protein